MTRLREWLAEALIRAGLRLHRGNAPAPAGADEEGHLHAPAVRLGPEAQRMVREGMGPPPAERAAEERPLKGSLRDRMGER